MRQLALLGIAVAVIFLGSLLTNRAWAPKVATVVSVPDPATGPPQETQEYYHTAGVLGAGQYPITRGERIDVQTVVAMARGPQSGLEPGLVCEVVRQTVGGTVTIRTSLGEVPPERRLWVCPGDIIVLRRSGD